MKEIPIDKPALKGLFNRIGGEKGLHSILKDFYGRMSNDTMIGFFFQGKDIVAIAEMQAAFLMRAMGVAPSYAGKAPAQAHTALPPILPGHFDRRLRLLEETLREHHVADEDMRTWIAFESAFRDGIVSR